MDKSGKEKDNSFLTLLDFSKGGNNEEKSKKKGIKKSSYLIIFSVVFWLFVKNVCYNNVIIQPAPCC